MPRSLWLSVIALTLVVCSTAGYRVYSTAKTEALLADARTSFSQQNYSHAVDSLSAIPWPGNRRSDVLAVLGECQMVQGRFSDAVKAFQSVSTESQYHQQASLNTAMSCLLDGKLAEAETHFRDHLEHYPDSKKAETELRWLYYNQSRFRDFQAFMRERLVRTPLDNQVLRALAESEFRPPMPRETLKYLEEVAERSPGQPVVQAAIGYCQWQLGNVAKANQLLKRANAIEPGNLQIALWLAKLEVEKGNPSAALATIQFADETMSAKKGMQHFEDDDRWWTLAGAIFAQNQQFEAASHCTTQAVFLNPFDLEALNLSTQVARYTGKHKEAAEYAERCRSVESAKRRLSEIVWARTLESPSVEDCLEIGQLNEQLGRVTEASSWRKVAQSMASIQQAQRLRGITPIGVTD